MLSRIREQVSSLLDPMARALASAGFTPNSLTFIGLATGSVAAFLFAGGSQILAGLALLACGLFDAVDGAVARITGKVTAFGGVLDSVVDRYVDFMIFFGIIYGDLASLGGLPSWVLGVAAMVGSFMVSYTRARGEAAGAGRLDIGVAERAERLLILSIGGLLSLTSYAVALIAVLTHITAFQRVYTTKFRLSSLR